jgi:tetratricopeptide (TPR) repeat protein
LTAESKKNPKLAPARYGVCIPFVTCMDFLFKEEHIGAFTGKSKSREKFLAYPKHLKLTLFYDDEKFQKVRKLEFMQRYMVVDELKEAANEHYFKADYSKAIWAYIQAYCCLKWLEFSEEESGEESTQGSQALEDSKKKIEELTSELSDDEKSKLKVDLVNLTEKSFKAKKQFKEEKKKDPKLRKMTAVFDDSNTKVCMDSSLTAEQDIKMRDGLLFTLLVNLGTAYLMNFHFSEAQSCFEEAVQINDKNSVLFFRWSQLLSYDELATVDKLESAKDLLRKCFECYSREKIFKEQNKMILKMLNLHNAIESYEYQRNFIDSQTRNKEEEDLNEIKGRLC